MHTPFFSSPEEEAADLYQCLSPVPWALWRSSRLHWSLLFSAALTHLEYATSHAWSETETGPLDSPPEKLECWTHAPLFTFPLRERPPSCISLCLLYCRFSEAAAGSLALFCSQRAPSYLKYAGSCQCSEAGKTEASPLGSPLEKSECWMSSPVFSFPTQGDIPGAGSFLTIMWHCTGGGEGGH